MQDNIFTDSGEKDGDILDIILPITGAKGKSSPENQFL